MKSKGFALPEIMLALFILFILMVAIIPSDEHNTTPTTVPSTSINSNWDN